MQASQKERNVLQSPALKPSVTQQSWSPVVFFLIHLGHHRSEVSSQQVYLQIGMIAVTLSTLASKRRIWVQEMENSENSWKDMQGLELHEAQTEFDI